METQCISCPNACEGVVCYNLPSCKKTRRHKVAGCPSCDREKGDFHPSHDASESCESGKRNHCTCDTCF
jgi:hypothetical protein